MKLKLYFTGLACIVAGAAMIAFLPLTDNLWGFFPLLLGMAIYALGWTTPRNWRNLQ